MRRRMETDTYKHLLSERQRLTEALADLPYDLILYLERATIHLDLDYPDLAAGDAYRALLLADDVRDDSAEYHEQALDALQEHDPSAQNLPGLLANLRLQPGEDAASSDDDETPLTKLATLGSLKSYQILATSLYRVGCLKSAHGFCDMGLELDPENQELKKTKEQILQRGRERCGRDDISADNLPDWGSARRETYPWNTFEPDRYASEYLEFLNAELRGMAPKCSVKIAELPVLLEAAVLGDESSGKSMCRQLGLFANEDIAPGEVVLREYTLLTANNRFKDLLCDACGEELPQLGSSDQEASVSCPECYDTVFCSQFCFDRAQEKYHPALCEKDVDSIARDPEHTEADERLHLLLLARVLAMASHQEVHPLDVLEVKCIWGDFLAPSPPRAPADRESGTQPPEWTLPFHFEYNVRMPLHFLEKMDIDIYDTLDGHDLWVFNTLYAKFRSTASARKNPRDGRPEVAAVHPFWCLANHDCDPNVTWEWGGRMTLWARETRVVGGGPGGIRKGEEILNHYCDLELPVQERREWALGSLGGWCMCARCQREAAAEAEAGAKDA